MICTWITQSVVHLPANGKFPGLIGLVLEDEIKQSSSGSPWSRTIEKEIDSLAVQLIPIQSLSNYLLNGLFLFHFHRCWSRK